MEQNISPIKQRILQYAVYKNISKRKIYIETGIANGVLDKTTGLTEDNIEKFISTYPEINPTWLLTGRGSMLLVPGEVEKEAFKEPLKAVEREDCRACEALERVIEAKEAEILALREIIEGKNEVISLMKAAQPAPAPAPAAPPAPVPARAKKEAAHH